MKKLFKNKKYISIFILLIFGVTWFSYSKFFNSDNQIKYVLEEVKKGDLEIFVSGAGFVSPINKVDLKSKVSGDVIYVSVKEGNKVRAGRI